MEEKAKGTNRMKMETERDIIKIEIEKIQNKAKEIHEGIIKGIKDIENWFLGNNNKKTKNR